MIEVSDRTRSECSIATVWAIMPPIDAPTTWALGSSRRVYRLTVARHIGQLV